MALLDILHFPDPRLRNVATPVEKITPEIIQLVDDMFETMYAAPGNRPSGDSGQRARARDRDRCLRDP